MALIWLWIWIWTSGFDMWPFDPIATSWTVSTWRRVGLCNILVKLTSLLSAILINVFSLPKRKRLWTSLCGLVQPLLICHRMKSLFIIISSNAVTNSSFYHFRTNRRISSKSLNRCFHNVANRVAPVANPKHPHKFAICIMSDLDW